MSSTKQTSVAIYSRPTNTQVLTPLNSKIDPEPSCAEASADFHVISVRTKANVTIETPIASQSTVLSDQFVRTEFQPSTRSSAPTQMSLLSRPVTLPPRPQPGRKPLQDEHGTKRQEQNRCAQRNFRKRKAETLVQLREDNEILRQENQEIQVAAQGVQNDFDKAMTEARTKMESLEKQVQAHLKARGQTEKEMQKLRDEMADLRREVTQQKVTRTSSATSSSRGMVHATPASPKVTTKPSSMLSSLILPPIKARNCGSCEPKTCVCFAESVQLPDTDIQQLEPEVEQDLAVDFTSWRPNTGRSSLPPSSQAPKRMAPGSCERCQIDPEQRAYCVSMAQQQSEPSTRLDNATHGFKRPRLTDTGITSSRSSGLSIPCVEAYPLYKRFERVASSVTEDMLRAEVLRKRMRVGAASAFSNLPTPPSDSQSQQTPRPQTLSGGTIVRLEDGGISRDGIQFSAHEVDLGQVLASLRNHGPASSLSGGSRTSSASDEAKTPGYEGDDMASSATSVAEGHIELEKREGLGTASGPRLQSSGVPDEGYFRF